MNDESTIRKFTATIAIAGQPNASGHVYTQEAIEKAVERFTNDNQPILGYVKGDESSLQNAALICKTLTVEENALVTTFQTLSNDVGKGLSKVIEAFGISAFRLGIFGDGKLNDKNEIVEFEMRSIGII